MSSAQIEDRRRWLSGMPPARRPDMNWWRRMVRSPLFWLTLVLLPLSIYGLLDQYFLLHPDREFDDGTVALGLNHESLRFGAYWAMWTALAYIALLIWLDRFRPQQPLVWLLTLLWGACISTWLSIHINSWAGQAMATTTARADDGTRPAIFVAPFSEEATKASVLFLLVILFRARIVSRLSIVTLSGLAAIGFAFVENIIYYARALVFATNTIEIEDPYAEVMDLVLLRGVYTSFGHPLFTMMVAFGVAVALGARSRIVRVVAPLAGFLLAAGGHMLFNGVASSGAAGALRPQWFMALALVALLVAFLVLNVVTQARLIRTRLEDFRRHGWLDERDPIVYSGPFRRIKLHLAGVLRGPRTWWATAVFMRRITELAYIQEGRLRGTVAEGGDVRAQEIIYELDDLRPRALTDTDGLRIVPAWRLWRRAPAAPPPPTAPGAAGLGGNWPAP